MARAPVPAAVRPARGPAGPCAISGSGPVPEPRPSPNPVPGPAEEGAGGPAHVDPRRGAARLRLSRSGTGASARLCLRERPAVRLAGPEVRIGHEVLVGEAALGDRRGRP